MGGNAFPKHPCPRLSHAIYHKQRDRTLAILRDGFFAKVTCPPEAPSKDDHGDVDVLVADPTSQFTTDDLSRALQAVEHTKTGKTTSFAVPLTVGTQDYMGNTDPRFEGQYVQIDIHVCKSEDVEWEMFHNSYGDLMQILGVMNRSIGLTANDRGLHLRLQDIEVYNKKKSMVYLSKDPREVMEFLGLDKQRYFDQGFASNEEIYDWCAQGRLYTPPSLTRAAEGGNETANDRQRYKKRPMFTICMNEYYPAHPDLFANRQAFTREDVIQEALKHFHHAQPSYDAALSEHKQAMWEKHVLARIKSTIPAEGEKLGETMRGLKRFVRYDSNGQPCLAEDHKEEITERPNWIQNVSSESKLDELLVFVTENWEAVRILEQQRMMETKAERARRGKKDSFRLSDEEERVDAGDTNPRNYARNPSIHSTQHDNRHPNHSLDGSRDEARGEKLSRFIGSAKLVVEKNESDAQVRSLESQHHN
ncbi:hypothetical protein BLS_004881 [Venturia inaequalis]|uniref:Uncharacterized protein n=1 Tax=Venturia inaequalis TaxID=5025 RepID=A0A8H3URN5_VENIN|nr:hypothetical protein EG328_009492 [Venturia inaequalis]KAE9970495.1 hypothetical protein BLS_004881 [Venturia inaequalis]KAE9975050.1 hypothetical protein EG327_008561 [Venturia inaequalis]RDI84967.1 hypothetical protein Vi05172_g5113 [Venturia inaequalis]